MKRRQFITRSAYGVIGTGLTGCGLGKRQVRQELTPIDFKKRIAKPSGTMPASEIGKTGIRVSKFGFGSHMRKDIIPYTKEREWMVKEAVDLGINLFDVYDYEQQCYQYEPMGRYLAPVINDVVISITMWPFDGRTVEKELERDLRLFGRDYIDLVRIHAWKSTNDPATLKSQVGHRWEWWETLFKMKEKGYIRAVGVPIHARDDLAEPLSELPLDFVILPYNFYHNWTWAAGKKDTFEDTIPNLRKKGIGVITMKPFAGDYLIAPLGKLAADYDKTGEINFAKACLRYVINSPHGFDATFGGMYNPYHLYENVDAYFNPQMTDEESTLLKKIGKSAEIVAQHHLPDHYRFLNQWV